MEKRFVAEALQPRKSWHVLKPQPGARYVCVQTVAYEYRSLSDFQAKFLGQMYHLFYCVP